MTDRITIPIDVVEAAAAALGNFVSDHGWSDSDMQAMDNLDSYIARHKAIRAELAKPVEQAEPVAWLYSVPGHRSSASCERIPLDMTPRGTAEAPLYLHPPTPAWHDAPTEPGLWMCNDGDDNPYRRTTHRVTFPLNQLLVGENERWYGPIPQDKEGGAA